LESVWPISAGISSPVNKRGIARLPMLRHDPGKIMPCNQPGNESPMLISTVLM
jgi:hypothetical protein